MPRRFLHALPLAAALAALIASCGGNQALNHYNLGIDALEHGDTTAALAHFDAATRESPDDPDIRINYGVALLSTGHHERAIAELEKATALAPDNAIAHLDLAEAYKAARDYPGAHKEYKQALRLSPNLNPALSGMGEMFLEQGEYDEAVSQLLQAARVDPDYAPTQFHLGWAYLGLRRPNDAALSFQQGLALNRRSGYGRRGLAEAYLARGLVRDALRRVPESSFGGQHRRGLMVGPVRARTG